MHLGGATAQPNGDWTAQQARILAMAQSGRHLRLRLDTNRPWGAGITAAHARVHAVPSG
jgi:hypothetical protein